MLKKLFATELRPGMQDVADLFVVQQKSFGSKKKNGAPYVNLVLVDARGSVRGFYELGEGELFAIESGDLVYCSGNVGEFNSEATIYIHRIEKVDPSSLDEDTLAQLYPSVENIEALKEELRRAVSRIKDEELRLFVEYVLLERLWQQFVKKPAAKSIHHARIGGLMEHSLHVAMIVERTADLYPEIDKDLALAGALLHDIGKVEEQSRPGGDYTVGGKLLGHIAYGALLLDRFAEDVGLNPFLRQSLLHIVLSHHGEREWGSPVRPQTLEALLVYLADRTDAYLDHAQGIYRDARSKGLKWSRFSEPLDASLFVSDEDSD
ncbi:HD domain-containing protein [Coprothermobacteraceae bacterium]|nr:HD domain-containing protein [Coprothermobacteraceae bacterium]